MASYDDFRTIYRTVDNVNSYIKPIILNGGDVNGRRLHVTFMHNGDPIAITDNMSAQMTANPDIRNLAVNGDYVTMTRVGDGFEADIPRSVLVDPKCSFIGVQLIRDNDDTGDDYNMVCSRNIAVQVEPQLLNLEGSTGSDSLAELHKLIKEVQDTLHQLEQDVQSVSFTMGDVAAADPNNAASATFTGERLQRVLNMMLPYVQLNLGNVTQVPWDQDATVALRDDPAHALTKLIDFGLRQGRQGPGTHVADIDVLSDSDVPLTNLHPTTNLQQGSLIQDAHGDQYVVESVGESSVHVSHAIEGVNYEGTPAGFGTIGIQIDGGYGTPTAEIETSGPATALNMLFKLHNLVGAQGLRGFSVYATPSDINEGENARSLAPTDAVVGDMLVSLRFDETQSALLAEYGTITAITDDNLTLGTIEARTLLVTMVKMATATVDDATGTPSVETAFNPQTGQITFTFHNLKGEKGDQGENTAAINSVSATIDNTTGTPTVTVEQGGTPENRDLTFHFTGMKGETGAVENLEIGDGLSGDGTSTPITVKLGNGLTLNDEKGVAVNFDDTTLQLVNGKLSAKPTDLSAYQTTAQADAKYATKGEVPSLSGSVTDPIVFQNGKIGLNYGGSLHLDNGVLAINRGNGIGQTSDSQLTITPDPAGPVQVSGTGVNVAVDGTTITVEDGKLHAAGTGLTKRTVTFAASDFDDNLTATKTVEGLKADTIITPASDVENMRTVYLASPVIQDHSDDSTISDGSIKAICQSAPIADMTFNLLTFAAN